MFSNDFRGNGMFEATTPYNVNYVSFQAVNFVLPSKSIRCCTTETVLDIQIVVDLIQFGMISKYQLRFWSQHGHLTIDISRRWCKLDFRLLQGQVKSCHFPERIDAWRQYFYILHKFLRIIGTKRLGQPFWLMI